MRSIVAVSAGLGAVLTAAPALAALPVIERVSVGMDGHQARGWSAGPELSADGRYVVFESIAGNLVPGDTNARRDVFRWDRRTGTTRLVSVSSTRGPANGTSDHPTVSADGRYVAFQSTATDLVAGDTNARRDVFVRDLTAGTTRLVSVSDRGVQGDHDSDQAAISADGRHVAFASGAATLVPGDTNGRWDVFVRDLDTATTSRVNLSRTGGQSPGDRWEGTEVAINADGRFVAFSSEAADLVRGDTNDLTDLFLRDRVRATTTRVSVSTAGTQADSSGWAPALSANGRFVAFLSAADNLVLHDTNATTDVFVRDTAKGRTTRESLSSHGHQSEPVNDTYDKPAISADGRYVAFTSMSSVLAPAGDDNWTFDVLLRDRYTSTTTKVSLAADGTEANQDSASPALSADGRFVAFDTYADNLVPGDTNDTTDVIVRRLR